MSALATRMGWAAALLVAAAAGLGGCTTDAFCFVDCATTSSGTGAHTGSSSTSSSTGEGGCGFHCTSTSTTVGTGGTGGGTCMPTNNGVEICDGLDNDCNGKVDDLPGLDLGDPKTCGTCSHNCFTLANSNWDPATIGCTPSADPGNTPGVCHGTCTADYFDIDKDAQGTCEYYCVKTASDDKACNGIDDNCNKLIDEDVDLCHSSADCGLCGRACTAPHATPKCVPNGGPPCDSTNTQCKIGPADCNPGFLDIDGLYGNGCEYQCTPTNGGIEICDGIDNDCNGVIDDAITQDPKLGVTCFGGLLGVCHDPAHAGVATCVAGQVVCTGANVVQPNDLQESCNGLDDDCNGVIDDNTIDTGPSFLCGASAVLPCQKGTLQCVAGAKKCVGNIDPSPETCDGVDNDCDGTIDDNLPAAQNGAACNVPIPPPAGATSPCKAGVTQCVNGAVQCMGSVVPVAGALDGCGVDANCNGVLTNQPDTMTDVQNCGACGNDCTVGAVHASWACVAGACTFQGCQAGYFDNGGPGDAVAGDHKCGYPCQFTSAQELCNGVDDNCDGQIDENIVAPSPVSVCGVSPAASSPECTTGITVMCVAGKWQCSFATPGVCSPSCAATAEICDGKDNNCNGFVDENVPTIGQACASDTGLPPPGDGACRTTGVFVCNGPSAVKCSAVKDLTKAGPELCDGIDNDCDGLVDEPFNNKGSNPAFFVKPVVTKVQASLWIYTYEASRPSSNNLTAGTGNGYVTSAPAGTTLDKTPACSVAGKIPWFNVTGNEVDQTCLAMGGHTCSPTEWQTGCTAKTATCTWGYAPNGGACTTGFTAGTKFCNLGMSYDFDTVTLGIQNGLLPTASSNLQNCWSDWSGALGNTAGVNDRLFDMTGNLREITKAAANQYTLMGGAFDSGSEAGSTCGFTFYNVDQNFEFYDTGFRCCFSADPTM